MTFTIFSMPS